MTIYNRLLPLAFILKSVLSFAQTNAPTSANKADAPAGTTTVYKPGVYVG